MNVICYLSFDFGLREDLNLQQVRRSVTNFVQNSDNELEEYQIEFSPKNEQKETHSPYFKEIKRNDSDIEHDIMVVGDNDSSDD